MRETDPKLKGVQSFYTHTRPVRDPYYFDFNDDGGGGGGSDSVTAEFGPTSTSTGKQRKARETRTQKNDLLTRAPANITTATTFPRTSKNEHAAESTYARAADSVADKKAAPAAGGAPNNKRVVVRTASLSTETMAAVGTKTAAAPPLPPRAGRAAPKVDNGKTDAVAKAKLAALSQANKTSKSRAPSPDGGNKGARSVAATNQGAISSRRAANYDDYDDGDDYGYGGGGGGGGGGYDDEEDDYYYGSNGNKQQSNGGYYDDDDEDDGEDEDLGKYMSNANNKNQQQQPGNKTVAQQNNNAHNKVNDDAVRRTKSRAQSRKDHLPNERLYKRPEKSRAPSPDQQHPNNYGSYGEYGDQQDGYDDDYGGGGGGGADEDYEPYKPAAKTPMPPAKKDKFAPNERLYRQGAAAAAGAGAKSRPASADRAKSRAGDVPGGGGNKGLSMAGAKNKFNKAGGNLQQTRTRANSVADPQTLRNGGRRNNDAGGYGGYDDDDYDDDETVNEDEFAVGDPTNELYDDYIKTRAPSRADGGGGYGGYGGLKTAKPSRANTVAQGRTRSLSVGDASVFGGSSTRGKTARDLAGASRMYDPWKARTVTFFKNGDVHHRGVTYIFRSGRDVLNFDVLCAQLTQKMPDLPTGVRFIFTTDGEPVTTLDQVRDGESYVCSSTKNFKKIEYKRDDALGKLRADPFGNGSMRTSVGSSTSVSSVTSVSSTTSSSSTGVPPSRDGGGRRIQIINSRNPSLNSRVLLNPKTSQSFEAILNDWGQVLKMKSVVAMYTPSKAQVRSLSQLRNDFADVDEFYLDDGGAGGAGLGNGVRGKATGPGGNNRAKLLNGAAVNGNLPRSQSEPNLKSDKMGELTGEPINVTIRGKKQTLFPSNKTKAGAAVKMDPTVPKEMLQLEWVYGYRGLDSVSNLAVAPGTGELVYYVAAVVVLYDKNANRQRHYIEHTEDITAMALHSKKDVCITGQKQGRSRRNAAHVRIWSLSSLQTLQVLGSGEIRIGVCSVAFSQKNKGTLAVSVDSGENHVMRVWQWDTGEAYGKASTQRDQVWGVKFHPLENNLIITYGRNHLCFWSRKRDGAFDRVDAIAQTGRGTTATVTITCVEFHKNGDLLTGDTDGKVTVWSVDGDGTYMPDREIQAHERSVTSMVFMQPEGTLVTGSEVDRRISAWDPYSFNLITETKLPEITGGVRTIVCQSPGSRAETGLFVGTTRNLILEGGLQAKFQPLIVGHAKQLWALAMHPTLPVFATAGYDRNILKWKNHRPEWRVQVQSECTTATFSEDGKMLAVGTVDGHVTILRGDSGKHVATFRTASAPVSAASFAPGGSTLGLASQNGNLYVYKAERGGWMFRRAATLNGKLPLAHFDWSSSGEYVRAQSQDHDLVYWNVQKAEEERNPERLKDESWHTSTCTISYDTAGIWKNANYVEESTISCCDRSYSQKLLVAGDVDGHLRLFRYPAASARAGFREMKTYSSYVSQAKFTFDDRYVITTGGTDAALMQWRLA